MTRRPRRGQRGNFPLEYATLIAVVTAALLGMAVYSLRAINGRWRTVADSFGYGRQYEPGVTTCTGDRSC